MVQTRYLGGLKNGSDEVSRWSQKWFRQGIKEVPTDPSGYPFTVGLPCPVVVARRGIDAYANANANSNAYANANANANTNTNANSVSIIFETTASRYTEYVQAILTLYKLRLFTTLFLCFNKYH